MKIFVPQQKSNKKRHDFLTSTEWNVVVLYDKVIVTLSGGRKSTFQGEKKRKVWVLLCF